LDISSRNWTKVNDSFDATGLLVPGPRFGMIYGTTKYAMIVAFGKDGRASSPSNRIFMYDFSSMKWNSSAISSGNPAKRFHSKGSVINDFLYTSHGFGDSDLLSDTQRLSLKRYGWEKIHKNINQYNPILPHARYGHGLVALPNNRMLIYGGCLSGKKSAGPCPSGDTWMYNIGERKWVKVASCPNARIFPGISLLPNSTESLSIAVLFGGMETGKQVVKNEKAKENELVIYDTTKNEWSHRSVLKDPIYGFPKLRHSHAMAMIEEGVVIFGGASTSNGELLNDVWILKGDVEAAQRSAILTNRGGSTVNIITLHGIFMFLAWAVCIQLGAFVARYMRHRERWMTVHKVLMVTGLTLAIVGFGLGIASFRGSHFSFAHGAIGLDIMLAGLYQPLNAAFRPAPPKDGEKPTLWRRIWEISHRFTGTIAVLLSFINISLGLFLSVAKTGLWISWFSYLGLIIAAFVVAEIRLRIKNKKQSVSIAGHENIAIS